MLSNEIIEISLRSLVISSSATLIAVVCSIPLAYMLASSFSKLSQLIVSICNALVSLPTVVIGLFLYMLFSRTGPLGILHLLYTPHIIILGQAILIIPLLISLFYDIFYEYKVKFWEMALALGATPGQATLLVIKEALPRLISSSLIGFARAIGELGIALMVGGNIRGYTRVLTTSIALEVIKGEFEIALMLGGVLLSIVLAVILVVRALRVFISD